MAPNQVPQPTLVKFAESKDLKNIDTDSLTQRRALSKIPLPKSTLEIKLCRIFANSTRNASKSHNLFFDLIILPT